MLKRWTTLVCLVLGGCLASCPALPEAICDGVLLEEASIEQLAEQAAVLGFEELQGLLGDDE